MADGTDPPAGLVGHDHRTVAHLLAEQPVERRRVAGDAMQQVHQSARGHRQSEGGPQQLGELGQRHAHLDVHLHRQSRDAGAQFHPGRAQYVGGLQPMPALHAPSTVRAMPDFDVEARHQRTHRRQFFLICDATRVTSTAPPQSGHAPGTGTE